MSQTGFCPRCGAALPAGTDPQDCPRCLIGIGLEQTEPGGETRTDHGAAPFPVPTVEEIAADFPQLEILEVLGQGGMGVVYKARQRSLDRLVALKILAVPPDAGPGFAQRFGREARALASLSHPSIVTVHDFGQAGGRYYLLMEYVDGANLHQLIRAGEVGPRQALQLVARICDALQFAHDSGVVHRDIKPENILVDTQGRVKIADFGLARILGRPAEGSRLTGDQQVMGTAHYMAPEQIERPLEVDHRADIYSLGVVFYELLTGELPLGRFQPPSRKVHVDVRIDEVVLKTLEKEPGLRYQQASEIRTDVERITDAGAGKVEHRSGATPRSRNGLPAWVGWAVLATVGMAAAALAVLMGLLWHAPGNVARSSSRGAESPASAEVVATEETPSEGSVSSTPGLPLVQAAARGFTEGVRTLLDEGLDVDAPAPDGTTALIEAVDRDHPEIVELLLARGADVNAQGAHDVTALIIAAARGNAAMVDTLLRHGADVNLATSTGSTALLEAVDRGHPEIVDRLLEAGANVEAAGPHGETPLILAVARDNKAMVIRLLAAGADPRAEGPGGISALSVAAAEGKTDLLLLLRGS